MISSMSSAACTALRNIRLSVGGTEVFGMRDLNPPVLQRQDGDVLVLLQIGQRLGRQVLDALQLAGLQPGDARLRLGHDAERHRVEAGLLVAAEAGASARSCVFGL